jgi:glucose/arabinose dehydrogenase/mono/diheme cytochrome c family protein
VLRPGLAVPHTAVLALLVATATGKACDRPSLPPGSPDNGGLALPDGFEAVVVHDGVGRARHLAVTDDGIVYVKLRVPAPKGLVALRDTSGDGRADEMQVFGEYTDTGDYGTAMRLHAGHIYFTTAGEVYRQRITPGQLVPATPVETVLRHEYKKNLRSYEHIAKPIAFDGRGHMFVPFGAPGDSCQEQNRRPESPGRQPCPELDWQGGVWQFSDSRLNQTEQDGRRYATGIRSLVAMSWNPQVGALYALQHGRDDFYRTWSRYFTRWQSAVLPSEEFFKITDGFDGGWPYYYFDQLEGKKKLNPEYGGDGQKVGDGDKLTGPVLGFPGHYAPNDLLFYDGDQFPERYRHGAFIAFHGSTIRMPYSQGGYVVAFVPFANGAPSGPWEVFADNFAGVDPIPNTSDAAARPMGLAQGPDGSLYVSDSVKGKIWRVMFKGDRGAFGSAQLGRMEARKIEQAHLRNPHEQNDVLGREVLDAGAQLYNTYCVACHQPDGRGDGARFPSLASTRWVSGDPNRLIGVVLNGLQGEIQVEGQTFNGVMPPNAFLTDDQVAQLLTYLRQNFGNYAAGIKPGEVAEVRARPPAPPTPPSPPAPDPPR